MAKVGLVLLMALASAASLLLAAPTFVTPGRLSSTRMSSTAASQGALKTQLQATGLEAETTEAVDTGKMTRALLSMVAALVVTFAPLAEAQAARSGGRIGGSAPSARPRPPPSRSSPPQATKERVIERNTTIIQQAPPMMGAPMMMAPAPSLGDIVVGTAVQGAVGGAVSGAVRGAMAPPPGASGTDRMLENQMRQDERQMDKQSNDIEDLKRQLAELKK
mmetsp:Transcript_74364/g.177170  ORF Transcript_74364/g.177170 Transcript_74364/m.177170 type:complete len:220 (+) Transcript_74364:85-744(+)|eukprot:CAMPEP_0178459486 /NCGR_PEP_ID=MMETSP0689_2-20121128/48157_1 /TAXON_ID=160604 /ORGANISM="Amphidinium massartii, Strain CS-259" /LENGTH=219 /DNA_ID=CAMNT_0020085969 /DNA_START=78 /DNA_END=737 /DNA_ORIENTATION=-